MQNAVFFEQNTRQRERFLLSGVLFKDSLLWVLGGSAFVIVTEGCLFYCVLVYENWQKICMGD